MTTKIKDDQLNESYIKQDGTRAFTGNQSMGNNRLTNVAAPVSDNDAARKIDLVSGPQIINSGTAVLDEEDRTYTFENWIWKFYGPNLEPTPFTTDEIPEEDEGFSKVYHVLGNQDGEFIINAGDSSDELLIDPSPIPGTLYLTRFVVRGTVIGEPEAPILGSEFVKKAYSNRLNLFPPLDGIYELPSDGRTSFNFVAGGFAVKGFSIPSGHEHLHEGKLFYFKNSSDDPITFEHAEAADVNYNLPEGENFVFEPANDKVLMFKFSFDGGLTLLNGSQSVPPVVPQEKQSLNYVVADLFDLGVASFDEVTPQIVDEYSESLEKPNTDNALFTLDIYEVYPNFDVTGNWEGHDNVYEHGLVTDEASFVLFLESQGATSVTINYFDLTAGRLQAKLNVVGITQLQLGHLQITDVKKISGFSGLVDLYLGNNQIVVFNPEIPLIDSLYRLDLFSNQIETFNPTLPLPSELEILLLNNNQIEVFNPSIPLPSGLKQLDLTSNLIYWFDPSIALPSVLEVFSLMNNQIEEFEPTIPLPSTLKQLFFSGNPMYYINIDFSLFTVLEQLAFSTTQMSAFNIGSTLPTSLTYLGFFNAQFNTAGYEASEDWATAQPAFLSTCNVEFTGNPDSVSGTNLETILISKNCNVIV